MAVARIQGRLLLFVGFLLLGLAPASASLPSVPDLFPKSESYELLLERLEEETLGLRSRLAAGQPPAPPASPLEPRFSLVSGPLTRYGELLVRSATTVELDIASGQLPSLPKPRVGGFRLLDPDSRPAHNRVSRGNDEGFGLGLGRSRGGRIRTNLYAFVAWVPSMDVDPLGLKSRAQKLAELTETMSKDSFRIGARQISNVKFRGRQIGTDTLRAETKVNRQLLEKVDQRFPALSVPYNEAGFVEFEKANRRIVAGEVSIGKFSGHSGRDVEAAWRKYAHERELSPEQVASLRARFTMHHDWEEGRLILVDTDVHRAYRHTGGSALAKAGQAVSALVAAVLPRTAEAMQDEDASAEDKAVAAGVDAMMLTPAGVPEDIEAGATWFGERLWNKLEAWLDSLGVSGEKKTEAIEQIE